LPVLHSSSQLAAVAAAAVAAVEAHQFKEMQTAKKPWP
jgi:hypothetical protein